MTTRTSEDEYSWRQRCRDYVQQTEQFLLRHAFACTIVSAVVSTLMLLLCIVMTIVYCFSASRSNEMSVLLLMMMLQAFAVAVHWIAVVRRAQKVFLLTVITNIFNCLFFAFFLLLVALKQSVENPYNNVIWQTITLGLINVLAILTSINAVRKLQYRNSQWFGTLLFGNLAKKTTSSPFKKHSVSVPPQDCEAAAGTHPETSEHKSSSVADESSKSKSSCEPVGASRTQAGLDEYPEDLNPFAEPDCSLTAGNPFSDFEQYAIPCFDSDSPQSIEVVDDATQNSEISKFTVASPMADLTLSEYTGSSEYLVNCLDRIPPLLENAFTDLPCRQPMRYMESLDNLGLVPLHPNSSVIVKKSVLPVPEYLERADFLSHLPNTNV